jgi:hypothetical protein
VLDGFTDIRTGEPARLATTGRLAVDDQALYVGFDCPEPDMAEVTEHETQHDGSVWLEDSVELFVCGAARTPYAHLIVTTGNVRLDEANQDRGAWNPELRTAVSRGDDRWFVELALPWSELAKAGVRREPVMTLNLGRNRAAADDLQPHTAWSCTYDGFHVPARFGLACLQQGELALVGLRVPDRWGEQTLGATLANRAAGRVRAEVRLAGGRAVTVELEPGATGEVELPVELRQAGPSTLELAWGVAGEPASRVALPVIVPEVAQLEVPAGLVSAGESVELPLRLGLAPGEHRRYRLVAHVDDGRTARDTRLDAEPGAQTRVAVRTAGAAKLQLRLLDPAGRCVWQGPEQTFVVLPE